VDKGRCLFRGGTLQEEGEDPRRGGAEEIGMLQVPFQQAEGQVTGSKSPAGDKGPRNGGGLQGIVSDRAGREAVDPPAPHFPDGDSRRREAFQGCPQRVPHGKAQQDTLSPYFFQYKDHR
jgi:hypothetical protein